jgi:hypothetical protein
VKPKRSTLGRHVYVAAPADELRDAWQRLMNDLVCAGYSVLPAEPRLPDEAARTDEFIRAALVQCEMSVHLLGESEGMKPDGSNEGIVRRQLVLAREHAGGVAAFPRILWAPKWLPGHMDKRDPVDIVKRFGAISAGEEVYAEKVTDLSQFLRGRPDQKNSESDAIPSRRAMPEDQIPIFISYAREDDAVAPDSPRGFVTFLVEQLEWELQNMGDLRLRIWRSTPQIIWPAQFDDTAIANSSILLVVLSRNWLGSPYCQEELEAFAKHCRAHGEMDVRHRIIVVGKNHVDVDKLPSLLKDREGYRFYARGDLAGVTPEYEFYSRGLQDRDRYFAVLQRLAEYLRDFSKQPTEVKAGDEDAKSLVPQPTARREPFPPHVVPSQMTPNRSLILIFYGQDRNIGSTV